MQIRMYKVSHLHINLYYSIADIIIISLARGLVEGVLNGELCKCLKNI